MTAQLRIYTINRGKVRQFAREWREQVAPLRIEHGFAIDGAWIMEDTNQFAWLLRYDGPEGWEEKEAAYYSSAGRTGMDPNPARLIAKAEERFVEKVL